MFYLLFICSILPRLLKFKTPGYFPKSHILKVQVFDSKLKERHLEEISPLLEVDMSSGSEDAADESVTDLDPSLLEENSCPICLEVMVEPASFLCGHSGCIGCLRMVNYCPVCRSAVPQHCELSVNISLRTCIARLLAPFPEYQRRRSIYIEESRRPSQLMIENAQYGISLIDYPLSEVMANIIAASHRNHTVLSAKLLLASVDTDAFLAKAKFSVLDCNYFTDSLTRLLDGSSDPVCYNESSITPAINCRTDSSWTCIQPIHCCDVMLRTMMRRALIVAEEADAFDVTREHVLLFVSTIIGSAITSAELSQAQSSVASKRLVVTCDHMLVSLRKHNVAVYGYGGPGGLRYLLAPSIYRIWYACGGVHPRLKLNPMGCSVVHDMITELLDTVSAGLARELELRKPKPQDIHVLHIPVGNVATGHTVPIAVAANSRRAPNFHAPVLSAQCIEHQVRAIFMGDMIDAGCAEGTDALGRFMLADPGGDYVFAGSMAECSGLRFRPEHVAKCVHKLKGLVLTAGASVYLAAICEYIVAVLLERAKEVAGDVSEDMISCRHLFLAMRTYPDLSALFPGFVRQGGVIPSSPSVEFTRELFPMRPPALVAYDNMIRSLARSAPNGIIVDPLTGSHVCAYSGSCVEELDAASASSVFERAAMATALLSDEQRVIVEAARQCPAMPRVTLSKIRMLQHNACPILDWSCFTRYVYEASSKVLKSRIMSNSATSAIVETIYSAEAMGALSTSLENHLHDLFTVANSKASRTLKTENITTAIADIMSDGPR